MESNNEEQDKKLRDLADRIGELLKEYHALLCNNPEDIETINVAFLFKTKEWKMHRHIFTVGRPWNYENMILTSMLSGYLFRYGVPDINIGVAQEYLMQMQSQHNTDDVMQQSNAAVQYHRNNGPDESVR